MSGIHSFRVCQPGRNLSTRGKFPAVVNLNTASATSDPQIQEKFSSSGPIALFLSFPTGAIVTSDSSFSVAINRVLVIKNSGTTLDSAMTIDSKIVHW